MLLYALRRYAFPKLPHFVPCSSSSIFLSSPFSLTLNLFAHSQTPNANNIRDSVAPFNRLPRMHPPISVFKINKILASSVKAKRYRIAISVFAIAESRGFTPDLVTLSILLNCYCHLGHMYSAFSMLGKIYKVGLHPDIVTLTALIKGLCIRNQVGEALDFYDDLMAKGFQLNVVSYGILINGLCKIGQIRSAIKLVRKMERQLVKPNVIIYNTVICSLCKGGHVIKARETCSRMIDQGILPDIVTYNSLIHGYHSKGQWQEATQLLDEVILKGIQPDIYTFNITIDMFCKEGRIIEAQVALAWMMKCGERVDVVTYNSLMAGYCRQGMLDEAMTLLPKMKEDDCLPDSITYAILLRALLGKSENDKVENLLHEIIDSDLLQQQNKAENEADRMDLVNKITLAITSLLNSQFPQQPNLVGLHQENDKSAIVASCYSKSQHSHGSLTEGIYSNEMESISKILRGIPGNNRCAECSATEPDRVSLNLAILLCIECSGVHRNLGVLISKVNSFRKTWKLLPRCDKF